MQRAIGLIIGGLCLCGLMVIRPVQAQSAPASICALTFVDSNQNGVRDPNEPLLTGVNVSLAIGDSNPIVIANHLSDTDGQYCFQNLTAGAYTLTFNAPLASATTATSIQLTLGSGEQLIRAFGGLPIVVTTGPTIAPGKLPVTLTRAGRLGLAAFGAVLAMLLMLGVGLIVRNLYAILHHRMVRQQVQVDRDKTATVTTKIYRTR